MVRPQTFSPLPDSTGLREGYPVHGQADLCNTAFNTSEGPIATENNAARRIRRVSKVPDYLEIDIPSWQDRDSVDVVEA
jgi:hypothetical protein